ncbi:cobalt ABC transporter permease [Mycoplasmopsis gallinacea]|uniref:Cobalt ABC transporter permease n=1 Tax=Mycoplasmopsis gallinacea TaxID=29556 RepID=A0A0D5ZKK4_9BACT|nr:cobalt ABC transporter permease [Mycoplasmopsis gallinacea]
MKSVFGRYIPGDNSFMYRLDPRIKILIAIFYIVFVFISQYFIDMVILLAPLIIVYLFTIKKVRPLISMLKFPIFVSLVILLVNIYSLTNYQVGIKGYYPTSFIKFFQGSEQKINIDSATFMINGALTTLKRGSTYRVEYGISMLTLNKTLSLFLRVYTMILSTTILTNTTRPILLTKALEDLMWPLKFLFVPVHIIAMIISIALRFIPTLLDEAQRIMKAQSSRGVDFKNGNIKEKVVAFTTLIIPLFISSFAKAEDLSNAMETRGYDPYEKRTKYRQLKLKWLDLFVVLFILSLMAFLIVNIVNPGINGGYLPSWYTLLKVV